ncbi:hypothetical protein KC622_00380 [Candidatus Dojkabacteria bacterium]|uniref:Uncharacterized protein n=1 Tax=Candidatus Dojkabacteria bacterium TaxID=2099670 RepID=A0A955HYN5_9BACT|nr:hypothetical protein [Candidatus Dojkabacteria bacterium]MCB9790482.1 hypothetical protein [Candidatus Nomurabacteria bacterium]
MQRGVIALTSDDIKMLSQIVEMNLDSFPQTLVTKLQAASDMAEPEIRLELSEEESESLLDLIDFNPDDKKTTSLRGKIQDFVAGLRN